MKLLALSLMMLIQGRFLWTLWDGLVNDGDSTPLNFGKLLGLFSYLLCAVTGIAGLVFCYRGGKAGLKDLLRSKG